MATHLQSHYAYLAMARASGLVVDHPFGLLVDSGLDCDTFNVVVTWKSEATLTSDDIEKCRRQFGARRFSWWVGPDAPPLVSQTLTAEGLAAREPEAAMSVEPLESLCLTTSPVRVVRVQSREHLQAFARVLAANWDPPDGNVSRFYETVRVDQIGIEAPVTLWLAFVQDQPVGTAELAMGEDGVAGLYNVATLASHRRRGIGTALTQRALSTASARGITRVELQASQDGRGLYERVGFTAVGAWREHQTS